MIQSSTIIADVEVPANFLLKGDSVGEVSYELDPVSLNWNREEIKCYSTNDDPFAASPSLRKCFGQNPSACCNYMQDDAIGSEFSSVIPEPCSGDYPELDHFICLPCMGTAYLFFKKAEVSKQYIDDIVTMKQI